MKIGSGAGAERRADTDWPKGVGLIRLAEVDSTSAEAFRLARSGETGPLWIVSVCQTAGRGRSGRHWQSEPGNLYASFLFQPSAPAVALHQLAFVAGVAAHEVLAQRLANSGANGAIRLKWPNDLLFDDAKIGGILTEATTVDGRGYVVIGIGLNIRHAPTVAGRATTSLAEAGVAISAGQLLPHLAFALDRWLAIWHESSGFAAVREAWCKNGPIIGQPLTVSDAAENSSALSKSRRQGRFAGLDDDGALLLLDEAGDVARVTYGDVTHGWGTSVI